MNLNPVVIHLECATERKALIANMEARLGPIRIHAASDGSAGWTDPAFSKEHVQPGTVVKKGAIGCYESHLAVLEEFKQSGDEYRLVLEDDCELFCSLEDIQALVAEANTLDWDMLYIGVNSYVRTAPTLTSLVKVKHSYGTHAIIMKRSLIPKMEAAIAFVKSSGLFYPYDWLYNKGVDFGVIALGPKVAHKYCRQVIGIISYIQHSIRSAEPSIYRDS